MMVLIISIKVGCTRCFLENLAPMLVVKIYLLFVSAKTITLNNMLNHTYFGGEYLSHDDPGNGTESQGECRYVNSDENQW